MHSDHLTRYYRSSNMIFKDLYWDMGRSEKFVYPMCGHPKSVKINGLKLADYRNCLSCEINPVREK